MAPICISIRPEPAPKFVKTERPNRSYVINACDPPIEALADTLVPYAACRDITEDVFDTIPSGGTLSKNTTQPSDKLPLAVAGTTDT